MSTVNSKNDDVEMGSDEDQKYQNDPNAGLPKFVEGEYNLNSETPTLEDTTPPPGCCRRFCSEWRYPGWFGTEEGSKTLDIPASFGPTTWSARIYKLVALAWIWSNWIHEMIVSDPDYGFFFAYLTYLTLTLTAIWSIVTFVNSVWGPAQPVRHGDTVSTWTKFSWLLFTLTANCNAVVVTLFWTVDFDYSAGKPPTYWSVMNHGITFLLCWIDGLIVSRIPVRLKHFPVAMIFSASYVIWLVIHQYLTDIGNPNKSDNDPETNDDLIYLAVNFKESAAFASGLVVFVVIVFVPLVHIILWALSLYSFPCGCSGYNRRYISMEQQQKSKHSNTSGGAEGPRDNTANVNIYEKP